MRAAAQVLRESGAELIFHVGDVGGRHVLDEMKDIDAAFVWGDTDKDRMGLLRHSQRIGVACYGVLADVEFDGKRIAFLHGDDKKLLQKLLSEQQHDFIIHGHGPEGEDRKVGKTRVIHPGSLYGGTSRKAALIDTDSDSARTITL
jgi:predicted phosphodiesterase